MILITAQQTTLKADIEANTDPAVSVHVVDARDNDIATAQQAIADWYNLQASPDYWCYKKALVPREEVEAAFVLQNLADITDTDRSRAMDFLRVRRDGINASDPMDRSGFDDVFSAAAGDETQQALIALWKRLVTNAERLFVQGAGAGSNADPDLMDVDAQEVGDLTGSDVREALQSA